MAGIDPGATSPGRPRPSPRSPGWRTGLIVLAFYAVVAAVATWPRVFAFRDEVPSAVDPVQHLMVMRWFKTCLLAGRSPFVFPGIQHPFGASIGNFPPMVLQTAGYLALSAATGNDALCYNILWFAGLLLTGLGTFRLAGWVLGDPAAATFAGVSAMLGGPVMLHARGHLELIYVGTFALFLVAWLRFVDRPEGRSMAMAAVAYSAMTLSSSYFGVLAVIPAAWALALRAIDAIRQGDRAWARGLAPRLVGFAALVAPALLLTFAGQLWNVAHGSSMVRPKAEFASYGVPWYGYFVPTAKHRLQGLFKVEAYDTFHHPVVECGSYLGVVTLGLILYAAVRLVRFPRAGFWWSITLILAVLSFGAQVEVGGDRWTMPGSWLYDHFFAFRFLRVPGRFNLFATVTAAVVAAAGLKDIIGRWSSPAVRWSLCATLTAVAVADLSMVPFEGRRIAPSPAFYARLVRADPRATFLEVPVLPSFVPYELGASTGYWQSFHRGRTTGGYSAHPNVRFDEQLALASPFSVESMADWTFLEEGTAAKFGIIPRDRAVESIWLGLKALDLRYLVLHRSTSLVPRRTGGLVRLERLLEAAKVVEEGEVVAFDRDRLATPDRPTLALAEGWRNRKIATASRSARLWAYNPDPTRDLTFTLKAAAIGNPRTARLRSGDRDLATWRVGPDDQVAHQAPTLRLPGGLQSLTIATDGDEPALSVTEVELRRVEPAGARP